MIRLSLRCCVLVSSFVLCSIGPSSAHDVWLTLSGQGAERRVIVNYGHPNDRPPTLSDKVVDLFAIGASSRKSLLDGIEAATDGNVPVARTSPFVDDGRTLLAARYDNGFWVKTADGHYRNATRRLVPDATERLWSGKFAKAVTGAGAPWQEVLGHELEIIPLTDPAAARPGETLKVRVLFRGQPLAGVEVERGDGVTAVPEKDIPRFATNSEGIAMVPIVDAGATLLVIDHKVSPSATPDQAGTDLFAATLWFVVGRGNDQK